VLGKEKGKARINSVRRGGKRAADVTRGRQKEKEESDRVYGGRVNGGKRGKEPKREHPRGRFFISSAGKREEKRKRRAGRLL